MQSNIEGAGRWGRMARPVAVVATWLAVSAAAGAATFVNFQEGNLRSASDPAIVASDGNLIDSSYNMGATVIRSDIPATAQDGSGLLVGNNNAVTNRVLLAFNVSYLTNLVGTNFSRIDSASLSLFHDTAGAGSGSVHAVCVTSPFDETVATWNNPHGGSTNAGGVIGTELREHACVGTNVSPTRQLWGSPAGSFWPDTNAAPDLLVDAVRGALTNGSKTVYLMVKRKSESASAYFSRYQPDGAATPDYRPDLIVGVDTFLSASNATGALAWYYFNENNNGTNSLAAVAAATITDPNRVLAGNATAGSGLGVFGNGGTTGNTHGYGTGGFVSAPSGLYVRCNVTPDNLTAALAGNVYVSFTLAPQPGLVLNLAGFSVWGRLQASNLYSATVVVRSSQDGFASDVASFTLPGSPSFTLQSNTLSGAAFTNVANPVEFRFYFVDNTDSTADIMRLDDVGFFGTATAPPAGVQIVTLTASDPTAAEPGTDTGAFTLRRSGDASGPLTVTYTISGTASNGVDYVRLSGTTNFASGVTNIVLAVVPIDDLIPEPVETVILTLNTNAAYLIAGSPSATVSIADNNDPPEFDVVASAPLALEGSHGLNGAFTISRLIGATNSALTVQLAFSGTASNGFDYVAGATNSLLFAPGVASRTVTISPIDDSLVEGNETVVLTLLPGTGYSVGPSNTATVTIYDNEGVTNSSLLVEAESFTNAGGWVVDQQFVDVVGSPYLLAHGKGRPVADAITTTQFTSPGTYRLWVRTKDWTAPLTNHPGSLKVVVNGAEMPVIFGTTGQGWVWQDGGVVAITTSATEVRLRDLTGFEGRCDALFFTTDLAFVPPSVLADLTIWRRAMLGLPATPPSAGNFDLVIVGGGIAGSAAAVAAARQGIQVALIHDRPFPGGNASRDVRVHTLGYTGGGIVLEINTPDLLIGSDQFIQSDERRLSVLQAETNLHLFTEWRAFAANTNGPHILSIDAKHNRTGQELRFSAPVFIDSTGDGWIGYWAGARCRTGREASAEFNESLAPATPDAMTQGTTLSWNSRNAGAPVTFPAVPWATNVAKDYYEVRGDWYWEYGLLKSTVYDAEEIRDHLLQAIYGTWWNVKQRVANTNLDLDWLGYIGGKRESRRLMGDYILSQSNVINNTVFPDAVVNEYREIDIHYPQAGSYDFLTYAQYTSHNGYWIPFRCLYSTNIDNLMMAGRCLSATHVGLGSPRVMNTGGQMGVATGTAAALCKKYSTTPRGVYQAHTDELRSLIGLTAQASDLPTNTVTIVDDADTNHVTLTGAWTLSTSTTGYYGADYIHDGNTLKGAKSVLFRPDVPLAGRYQVYLRWTGGANRSTNTPVDINAADGTHTLLINQMIDSGGWALLGTYPFVLGNTGTIVLRTTNTTGYVIADAVLLGAAFPLDPNFTGSPWEDDDGDAVCNYVEWLNGTDPLDPTSFIKASLTDHAGASSLRFETLAGKSYTIQYCDAFGTPWKTLQTITASPYTQEITFTDPLPRTNATRFYRLSTP